MVLPRMFCTRIALSSIFLIALVSASISLNIGNADKVVPFEGRICAYGDFDKDRYTDLLVQRGNTLQVMLQSELGQFSDAKDIAKITLDSGLAEVFCAIGDFDGDASLDVLVTKVNEPPSSLFRNIFSGAPSKDQYSYESTVYFFKYSKFSGFPLNVTFLDHPSIMDINGDGIADIIGFEKNNSNSTLCCMSGDRSGKFLDCKDKFIGFKNTLEPVIYFGPIFADIDGATDLGAEVVFAFKQDNEVRLSVWKLKNENYEWIEMDGDFSIPHLDVNHLGSPIVSDFNADAVLDILIPGCVDEECTIVTSCWIWSNKKWTNFQLDLKGNKLITDKFSRTVFRVGDFLLDGYPDLIATININDKVTPMILENMESDSKSFNRKFELKTSPQLILPAEISQNNIKLSAFFDLKEDGNLDILMEYSVGSKTKIGGISCDDKGDTTFLKVQTFTNVCTDKCPNSSVTKRDIDIGSGITWHGACVAFTMTDSWAAGSRVAIQCQLPQTSHRTFHSPFVLFGLGRSPNFVDEVRLGSPRWVENAANQRHALIQIVPNSRLMVVPPDYNGVLWQSRLYLTPSRLIIRSVLVLASVCVILLLLVFFLHFRERQQDRKERQAQTHRFHFDAM